MITGYLRYVIDPSKLSEFETYSRMIMPLWRVADETRCVVRIERSFMRP